MNRHTTTHPDTGQVATRNSENRVYTHAVWAVRPAAYKRRILEDTYTSAVAQAARLREAAEGRGLTYTSAVARRDAAIARGSSYVPKMPAPEDYLASAADSDERAAAAKAQLDAGVTDDTEWWVDGWNGRLDLAQKKASTLQGKGFRTLITEAVVA